MTDAASHPARPLPPFAAMRSTSSLDALVGASLIVVGRPALWAIALLGFLARGGLLLLLVPIVVLPSPIQLAASFGLDAVSISGEPTSRFIIEVTVALGLVVAWVVLSGIVGAGVEIVLGRAVAGGDDEDDGDGDGDGDRLGDRAGVGRAADGGTESASGRLVGELLVARLLTLVPVVVALAWGVRRVVDVGYREVTVPSDTATPLVLRIVEGAADAVFVIVLVWLVTELVLAVATRHLLFDAPAGRSGREAVRGIRRRPLPLLIGFVTGTIFSVLALGACILAMQATWQRVEFELRADTGLGAVGAIVLLVLVWGVALVGAGFLSAWRSALMSGAYLWTMEAQDSEGP